MFKKIDELTQKQNEIYRFIVKFALKHGCTPTYREIGAGVNLKSTSSVAWYMKELEDKGYIKSDSYRYKVKGLSYIYKPNSRKLK